MKSLLPVVALVAGIAAVTPALAQPLDITVRGGSIIEDNPPRLHDDSFIVRTPVDPGFRFDPGQAAINALAVSHFYPPRGFSPLNIDRAITLNATGDSILEHQLKCQAAYPSYDLASDTYISSNGIPRPCRL
ncbi:MAG TPA: BA14K family protein [Alphaproteobacteria bacterium]|nr:BA14K family protein [Alphaproteobacteria bacterium]